MGLPVLTAGTGAQWEADLVAALEHGPFGLTVVRRCVDLADLLATAAAGTARAALIGSELRRLDRDALSRLAAGGMAVVGVVTPGDEAGERRLRQLGVDPVLSVDAGARIISAATVAAVSALSEQERASPQRSYASPAVPSQATRSEPGSPTVVDGAVDSAWSGDLGPFVDADGRETGKLIAVWGPTGAPGRTTLAVNIAAELAAAGRPTLLADADTYGGAVAQFLGLLDEAPGLAAAARLANSATLDLPGLARVARAIDGLPLRVLTGISRPDRWPDLRPSSLEVVWSLARRLAAYTVADCGFSLEQDEELAFDTAAPRRNGATLATLEAADVVLVVGAADPVGLQRLTRGLGDLADAVPGAARQVVVNRIRRGPIGAGPEQQIAAVLNRFAGVDRVTFVPDDQAACDRALARGRALLEVAPDTPVRRAIAALAAHLAGRDVSRPRRVGRFRRRVGVPG
jgi:MinD-like ATPase involved in chromosome partitioning or flagellar assembly